MTNNSEAFIQFSDSAMAEAREIDPSVVTQADAARVFKEQMSDEHLSRPENMRYYVYVMRHEVLPDNKDLYEELACFEHLDNEELVVSLIPQISAWFQKKYAGNKDAWLSIEKIGVPSSFAFGYDDKHLGYLHKEDIKDGE